MKRAKAMIDKKKLSLEAPGSYKIGDWVMSLFGAKVSFIRDICHAFYAIELYKLVLTSPLYCNVCSYVAFSITGSFVIRHLPSQT